jgi:uncharacterized damage-inducible protein DinB
VRTHFAMMANYNAWANVRLYRMADQLPEEKYRRDVGAYFKSLHGTLNHLLTADRIWMYRLTGAGSPVIKLDAILFEDLPSLTAARREQDARIIQFVHHLTDEQLEEMWDYHSMDGRPQRERRREILAHLFNHETHHRGQAHAILTALGVNEPDSFDLILMLREHSG